MDRKDEILMQCECVDKKQRIQLDIFIDEEGYDTDAIETDLNEGSESNIKAFLQKNLFLTGYFRKAELTLTPKIIPESIRALIIKMSKDTKQDDNSFEDKHLENIKFVLLGGFFILAIGVFFHSYRNRRSSNNTIKSSISNTVIKEAASYLRP